MSSYPVGTNSKSSARGQFLFGCVVVVALFLDGQAMSAAKPSALVTILQGSATVIRVASQFSVVEGVRLMSEDLVRTDQNSFLRIEYEDGTWIELGPASELQLGHPADKRAKGPALYVLTGWLKLGCAASESGGNSLASSGMDLSGISGTIIIRTVDATHAVFAEMGTARWIDRAPRASEKIQLNRGDFLTASKSQAPQVKPRPAPEFVSAMPVEFRDALPNRYMYFASRNVVVKDQHPFAYADVEQWLNAEPSIRRQFIPWWRKKAAQEPEFRAALDRNLSLHPEWDPVLHPEKYEKDDASTVKNAIN